jgi:hypothetical protein
MGNLKVHPKTPRAFSGTPQSKTANRESIGGPVEQDRWWESREKGRNEHKKDDKENI